MFYSSQKKGIFQEHLTITGDTLDIHHLYCGVSSQHKGVWRILFWEHIKHFTSHIGRAVFIMSDDLRLHTSSKVLHGGLQQTFGKLINTICVTGLWLTLVGFSPKHQRIDPAHAALAAVPRLATGRPLQGARPRGGAGTAVPALVPRRARPGPPAGLEQDGHLRPGGVGPHARHRWVERGIHGGPHRGPHRSSSF